MRVLELERELRERDALLEEAAAQLLRARREVGAVAGDAGALAGALAGDTSTASFAELVASTGGFEASRILGRGGFGPVYRGEWAGQAVAIKRLDHVCAP